MAPVAAQLEVPIEKLRWRLEPETLAFETTDDLQSLEEIIGQDRGVEAFRFGINIDKPGYNIFVTGMAGSGRKATVQKLLAEMSKKERVPDDLCYVNCFKNPETPVLIRLPGGTGADFKNDVKHLVGGMKKEIPEIFESQEYINMKKGIMEAYEKKANGIFKAMDKKVKEEGFQVVDVQVGQFKRPEVMPVIDEKPTPIEQLEPLVESGKLSKEEFEALKQKHATIKKQIEKTFLDMRDMQKQVKATIEDLDRTTVIETGKDLSGSRFEKYGSQKVMTYIEDLLEDMADHIQIFAPQSPPQAPGAGPKPPGPSIDLFHPYNVNLLVDNRQIKSPPVITEEYPTYSNIFGSIERVIDRTGVWRTDYNKIKAGSLLKANGGFLVINLRDAIIEPGVWPSLKRALKSKKLEIQSFDPIYAVATSGLKPEPIALDVKVVLISDSYLYTSLLSADEDLKKVFKVRADFDTVMDKTEQNIMQFAKFIKMATDEEGLRPLDRSAVAALVEQAVRMAGRQEKISTCFPAVTDLIREADYWADQAQEDIIKDAHIDRAVESKIFRSNRMEQRLQEMIDRGTVMIDTDGEVIGQVNGLAVYSLGDYSFGKPSRITASTSMGRVGLINIEREAKMSGKTHDKGVLILSGYLRKKFAQDKPLTISASIAFEQSYSGVDGDSASSTEIYALLSSLSKVPIKQEIAVTGSVNQRGEVQAIGGVNQKIEGFFDCCRHRGLNGHQGVMIPASNVNDLMLRKDVVDAVEKGQFTLFAVETIDQGIEILTGKPAGEIDSKGSYPEGTINSMVDQALRHLAEGLKNFGNDDDKKKDHETPASDGKSEE